MMFSTSNERDTERLGERLAGLLEKGTIVGLVGPLGAGKTTLVRGIARGLGVDERAVSSPSFLTAAEYQGRLPIAHLDLYRHGETLPDGEWLAELLDADGIALVEWYEHLGELPSDDVLRIEIGYGRRPNERTFTVRARGSRATAVVDALEHGEAG